MPLRKVEARTAKFLNIFMRNKERGERVTLTQFIYRTLSYIKRHMDYTSTLLN